LIPGNNWYWGKMAYKECSKNQYYTENYQTFFSESYEIFPKNDHKINILGELLWLIRTVLESKLKKQRDPGFAPKPGNLNKIL
jgi:hypothetical protein